MSRFKLNNHYFACIIVFLLLGTPVFSMEWNGTHTVCSNGPAQVDPTLCLENKCFAGMYTCPNGFCSKDLELCSLTSNCPLDRPFICPNLVCVSAPDRCPTLPAFKHRPPFTAFYRNTSISAVYTEGGSSMQIDVGWDQSYVDEFTVYLGPVSDAEAQQCTLLTDNSDQENAIRMIVQPGVTLEKKNVLNPLLTMMSPIINISTEGGGDFPAELTVSLQINPYFDYSAYTVAIFDMENSRIRTDKTQKLEAESVNGVKMMSFKVMRSGIYAIIFFPYVRPDSFYGFIDCGWACIYPREFMFCFFSAIYATLVVSMTFWCIAIQTEQKRINRKKEIKRRNRKEMKRREKELQRSQIEEEKKVEVVEEEKKQSPVSVRNLSFAGGSPTSHKMDMPAISLEDVEGEGVVKSPTKNQFSPKMEGRETQIEGTTIKATGLEMAVAVPTPETLEPKPPEAEIVPSSESEPVHIPTEEAKEADIRSERSSIPNESDKEKLEKKRTGADEAEIGPTDRSQQESEVYRPPERLDVMLMSIHKPTPQFVIYTEVEVIYAINSDIIIICKKYSINMLRLVKKCGWSWARALTARNFAVSFAITPNPLCLKFMPDRELIGITPGKEYRSVEEAKDSPLSKAILSLEGVQKLMFGRDFVSVTKKEYADWESLKPKVSQTIDQYIDTYKPEEPKEPEIKKEQKVDKSAELEAVSMIKDLIEFRIRPMLLDDGGDIQYRGFNPKTGVFFIRYYTIDRIRNIKRGMRRMSIECLYIKRRY
eukprot:TRINITY_DN892_c0_g1_i3.p1 TRINITY_DN892_c0_g1~~TRINITY_DN892_c0_g1_i3.p1  ORF type:complete len:764 (-),score=62.86 TRINITY_DN892_c0_g1_i3:9287-11578(-)